MKWNNRLKSVLTKTEESVFSEECLETQVTKGDKTHLKLVSSPFVTAHSRQSFKNNDALLDFKSEKLHKILNRFIENGVTFDVSTDDFQIVDNAGSLKTSDREFLELNYSITICTLQQSLLMKHLFSHSPEQFEVFAFEITEREAVISEDCLNSQVTKGDKTRFEIYFRAVESVTRKWFDELLKKKEG
jgi:hypothetical protein